MTPEDRPSQPPLAADEQGALLGALDRLRWTFRFKVDGLDGTGMRTTIGAPSLTLGAATWVGRWQQGRPARGPTPAAWSAT